MTNPTRPDWADEVERSDAIHDAIEEAAYTQRPNGYTMEDFTPILNGEITPPNTETIDWDIFLDAISSTGHGLHPIWGHAWLTDRSRWTMFFLRIRDGSGYAVSYPATTYTFAICRHTKVLRPTDRPNHIRGWHPGICSKCGLNMDLDSGD